MWWFLLDFYNSRGNFNSAFDSHVLLSGQVSALSVQVTVLPMYTGGYLDPNTVLATQQ